MTKSITCLMNGQAVLTNQSTVALMAVFTAAHTASTIVRNVSLCFHSKMMPATRAATARTTRPIGLAFKATFRAHCTAVQAIVAARTIPIDTATAAVATRFATMAAVLRSEEHTSELQSLAYLVCR